MIVNIARVPGDSLVHGPVAGTPNEPGAPTTLRDYEQRNRVLLIPGMAVGTGVGAVGGAALASALGARSLAIGIRVGAAIGAAAAVPLTTLVGNQDARIAFEEDVRTRPLYPHSGE